MINANKNTNSELEEINSDFSSPVIVRGNIHDWSLNNKTKLIRKRLEYINIDGPRHTSLVQLPPGQQFKKCSHTRGEEFLVLSGDYSNDKRNYNAGTYVRNPPGKQYKSSTKTGCTLLFKTGHFQKRDNKRKIVHPYDNEKSWVATSTPGVFNIKLHQFLDETVSLYKISAQCWMNFRQHTHNIEILIYRGTATVAGIKCTPGTWFRYPPNSQIKITASSTIYLFVKKGKIATQM